MGLRMSLYTQIASHNSLLLGFNKVQESDGAAGIDKVTITAFEEDLENQINLLHNELTYFNYRPQPVIFFERKKADGKTRLLSIFSVRDRVAQSSLMIVLNPIFESEYEKESYGFRKGISREDAARHIYQLYNEGYKWVLDTDIKDYFDSVNHELLFKHLDEILKEAEVIALIKKWVECECFVDKKKKTV
jgi:retron-type reverse transcriptase